ncbi:glycosyltransferase family 2 protein [Labrenzia sp. PHM005]|uniref:glycosyltransferase family 2 protein n=1 Tax=Labrenzia sp. PHM005 TaxID=2590016 RepID=UPI0011403A87|nr:glycosyltransferase family 2 protein [Labrenzia sp. PHM005]QDG78940.1 glycosyltransferase [Labrenzia sp. PHM005]
MQDSLPGVLEILLSRGVPRSVLKTAHDTAEMQKIQPEEYLLRHALVTTECLYSAFAELCDVPFLPENGFRFRTLNDRPLNIGEFEFGPVLLSLHHNQALYAIAPEPGQFEAVYRHLQFYPDLAKQIRIATPDAIHYASSVTNSPAGELEIRFPAFSARNIRLSVVFMMIGAATVLLIGLSQALSDVFLFVLTGIVSLACLGAGGVRIASALATQNDDLNYKLPEPLSSGLINWPRYTVLVPLYREARVIPELLRALKNLSYPRHKLQVILLIEKDDVETAAAIPGNLPACFDVLSVPDGHPRTKPRALDYGLAAATGEFVTVYDAEDRPDPDQLKKAAFFFAQLPKEFACLQARLVIDNGGETFISRHFALEYICLFDQLLPWLFRHRWPFPLGGTSNHFKISALHAAGGWDRYNVTEDADLGVRLERLGFRLGMLPCSTLEEAPVSIKAWLAQRARWHKGWLQTVFVHARYPKRLLLDLGAVRSLVLAALFLGTFLLVALHPVFFALVLTYLLGYYDQSYFFGNVALTIMFVSGATIGYAGTLFAIWMGARRRHQGVHLFDALGVLVYWSLAGVAFYRAVWELASAPYHWNKTEHGLSRHRTKIPSWEMKQETPLK